MTGDRPPNAAIANSAMIKTGMAEIASSRRMIMVSRAPLK
jgi:hypothetical protein